MTDPCERWDIDDGAAADRIYEQRVAEEMGAW